MTKISRDPVESKRLDYFINNFWILLTLLGNKEQIKDFLKYLFSPTEIVMFAKRLQIGKMLLEGYKYEDIKRYVKVTDQPVTRINNFITGKQESFIKTIGILIAFEAKQKEEFEKSFKKSVYEKRPDYELPEKIMGVVAEGFKKYRRKASARK